MIPHEPRTENFDRCWYKFAAEMLPAADSYPRAVDLGCGRGEFAWLLRDRGFNVAVADVDPCNVVACQALGFSAKQADFNRPLPFETAEFDLVIMLEVIEHVPLADHLVVEISRILRHDGLLLLSTPNCAWILQRLRSLLGHPPPGEGRHFRFFVQTHLTDMLKSAGFEIERTNDWTYPLPPLNQFRRWYGLPRVDWHVPSRLGALWACDFVWLVRNNGRKGE